MTNRIDSVLNEQPPGLWPFLAAGYPNVEVTAEMLRAMGRLPIRGVEVGFPFSDPIADGPVIQQAFSEALAKGVRIRQVFDMIAAVRREVEFALLAMVSASIVYRLGLAEFVEHAKGAGFDGVIVPDLSLEEAPSLAAVLREANLGLSMLIAPTTSADRQRRIAETASGFLYYVSVQGTTGERSALPADLGEQVGRLKTATGCRVLVGFGISTPEHVREVCTFADGAIVGSAIVRRIGRLIGEGRRQVEIIEETVRFVGSLAGA
jgi:tryptophan synthase alpha chain